MHYKNAKKAKQITIKCEIINGDTMENNRHNLIQTITETNNPALKAQRLTTFIVEGFKKQNLNLYEGYLLYGEVIHYTRDSYILPAWNRSVQVSTCLALLNQRLLALAFRDKDCVQQLEQLGKEAFGFCVEKRAHYIMDRYHEFIALDDTREELLEDLFSIREKYNNMNDAQGPYHVEVFPYHYFAPEKILLDKADLSKEKWISEDVEVILIALNT